MTSAPDASWARTISDGDAYLPVPTKSREPNVFPAIVKVSMDRDHSNWDWRPERSLALTHAVQIVRAGLSDQHEVDARFRVFDAVGRAARVPALMEDDVVGADGAHGIRAIAARKRGDARNAVSITWRFGARVTVDDRSPV